MRQETVWCDICEKETDNSYQVVIRWTNSGGFHRFDLCEECKDSASSMIIHKDKKLDTSKDKTLLGILRMFIKKKDVKQ